MDKITPILDQILAVGGPYLPAIGVFIFVIFMLGLMEELIGLRGFWKWFVAFLCALLFFHFGDDVALKFSLWMQFLGLQPVQPGLYK